MMPTEAGTIRACIYTCVCHFDLNDPMVLWCFHLSLLSSVFQLMKQRRISFMDMIYRSIHEIRQECILHFDRYDQHLHFPAPAFRTGHRISYVFMPKDLSDTQIFFPAAQQFFCMKNVFQTSADTLRKFTTDIFFGFLIPYAQLSKMILELMIFFIPD